MNRNLDRTPLTIAQLTQIALNCCGVTANELARQRAAHQKDVEFEGWLLGVTRQERFEMMARGELILDTSEPFVPKEQPTVTIDPFWLTRQTAAA